MKRYLFLFALVVLALSCIVLTACGRKDPEDTTAPATTAPVTTAEATTPPTVTTTSPVATTAPVVTTAPAETTAPPTTTAPAPTLTGATVTYDGQDHAVVVEGELPAGSTVLYSVNGADAVASYELINAGTYEVVATVTLPAGYEPIAPLTCTVVINKAVVDMSAIEFPAANTATFDDTAKIFEIADLPTALSVVYTYTLNDAPVTEMKGVGVYTVTATFELVNENYELSAAVTTLEATFTITPAVIDMSEVAFPAVSGDVFDDAAKTFEVLNLPANVTVVYTYTLNGEPVDELKAVGVYTVTATFTAAENYVIDAEDATLEATFTIAGAAIDMSGVAFPAEDTILFDGSVKTFEVVGLPANVSVVYAYTLNGEPVAELKNAGVYTVTATFSSTDPNYAIAAADATKEATFTIEVASIDMADVAFPTENSVVFDDTAKTFEVLNLPTNVTVVYTYTLNGEPVDEMKDAGVYTVTATFTAAENYQIDVATLEGTFTITPISISIADVVFEGATAYITDLPNLPEGKVTVVVAGLPAELAVRYEIAAGAGEFAEGNSANEIGEYTVKAYITATSTNYVITEAETTLTATISIKALQYFDMEGVELADTPYTVNFGDLATLDALTLVKFTAALPEGLSYTVSFVGADGEVALTDLVVGEYTLVVTFVKSDDDEYKYYNTPEAMETAITVTAKKVTVADLGLDAATNWNYANHEDFDAAVGAIEYTEGFSYEMTLTAEAEAILTEAGITVTYKTYLVETGEEVDGPVTARGTYKTVAVLTAIANYEIADPETEIALEVWGVFAENWTPKPAL